jgi:hypothetical protein
MAMITTLWVWKMNKAQPFSQHHITRAFKALRAAEAAGTQNPSLEVHLPSGAKIVVGCTPDKAATTPKPSKVRQSTSRGKA